MKKKKTSQLEGAVEVHNCCRESTMMLFQSNRTKLLSKKMLGNMKPSEILELVNDDQIRRSDVPQWVNGMIEEYCTVFVERVDFYEARFNNRYRNAELLIEKMVHYRSIWVNWDGLEPFPWREERPIKYYYDSHLRNRVRDYRI